MNGFTLRIAAAATGLALGVAALSLPAMAMSSDDTNSSSASSGGDAKAQAFYDQGKKMVNREQYGKAIPLLKQAVAAKSGYADALNLLGYSYRKSGDANKALDFYGQALKSDPKHPGANEYLGELYLELNRPADAEKNLAVLKASCGDCEEFQALDEAITAFKAKQTN